MKLPIKNGYGWMKKRIQWELAKWFGSDHANKCDMHKSELVVMNEILKFAGIFKSKRTRQFLAQRPDLISMDIKMKTYQLVDFFFFFFCRTQSKIEKHNWKIMLENWKKKNNMKVTVIHIFIGVHGTISKRHARNWNNWKSEELKPSRRNHCYNHAEYRAEFWRIERTWLVVT